MSSVAILFNRLGPYHVARIAAAAERFPTYAVEFSRDTAVYAWDPVDTGDSFPRFTVVPEGEASSISKLEFAKRLMETLNRIKPSVIAIPGWDHPGALFALLWASYTNTPAVMMSESQRSDRVRKAWKESFKARIVRSCSAALVGGKPQVEYIQELGIPASHVFHGYDAVDNEYFAAEAARVRSQDAEHRARLGLPERFLLASSRFVPKKNLPKILRAYALYRGRVGPTAASLVVLGDGPMRKEVLALRSELGLKDSVLLPGFKQYGEIPAYYGLAEAFIHASTHEQWGLVVNEAMAAGLPVLVSNRCGCAADLVREGENGFSFDPDNEQQLAGLMEKVLAGRQVRLQMGRRGEEIVAGYAPAVFAEQLAHARDAALALKAAKRVSGIDMALLGAMACRSR